MARVALSIGWPLPQARTQPHPTPDALPCPHLGVVPLRQLLHKARCIGLLGGPNHVTVHGWAGLLQRLCNRTQGTIVSRLSTKQVA